MYRRMNSSGVERAEKEMRPNVFPTKISCKIDWDIEKTQQYSYTVRLFLLSINSQTFYNSLFIRCMVHDIRD